MLLFSVLFKAFPPTERQFRRWRVSSIVPHNQLVWKSIYIPIVATKPQTDVFSDVYVSEQVLEFTCLFKISALCYRLTNALNGF